MRSISNSKRQANLGGLPTFSTRGHKEFEQLQVSGSFLGSTSSPKKGRFEGESIASWGGQIREGRYLFSGSLYLFIGGACLMSKRG